MAPQQLNVLSKLEVLCFFAKPGFYIVNFSKATLSLTSKNPSSSSIIKKKKKGFDFDVLLFASLPTPVSCPQGHLVKKSGRKTWKIEEGEENH